MKTEIMETTTAEQRARAVAAAVDALKAGNVVALPTETVYGLAADATNAGAVARIFEAKERPLFDPLIVHVAEVHDVGEFAQIPEFCSPLIEHFWPGPLTLILPRQGTLVPDIVTAGFDTVAVRSPVHPFFREVLSVFGKPIAAPSANRFGRISPTAPEHVLAELDGRIPMIIAADPSIHGVESTIVLVEGRRLRIVRNGPITPEQLSGFGEAVLLDGSITGLAPGQLKNHYSPSTPLVLIEGDSTICLNPMKRYGLLRFDSFFKPPAEFDVIETLSRAGDLREAAHNLFAAMRRLDASGVDIIVAQSVKEQGLGHAIMDRLRRAAARE
jgi:L-threonylcarbamoyladenylate synthase